MIYIDSSVALAHLLAEDRAPPSSLWSEPLVASRFLEYEIWNSLNARGLGRSHGSAARALVGRLTMVEMEAPALERALQPFPRPVRTLDALHLASMAFLRDCGMHVALATYDKRLATAAQALDFPLAPI